MKALHREALDFLREHGHEIGDPQGGTQISIDGTIYKITELHLLAEKWHVDEWRPVQRSRDQEARKQNQER
jgi:hypothetical protein